MPNMDIDEQGGRLSESTLMELETLMEQAAARGIRDGIRAAVQDDDLIEAFWDKGVQVAKRQAKMQAGSLLFDSFTGFFSAIWKYAAVGMIAYHLGGWELLTTLIKGIFIKGPS